MKKIVIEPCFNESHFQDCHIENICEYLKPDIYVISEGLFPTGPEGKWKESQKIIKNYTLNGEGKRSFDYDNLVEIIERNKELFPNIEFHLLNMDYNGLNTQQCFEKAYKGFLEVYTPNPDDIIIPLECDLLVTQEQATRILQIIDDLKEDEGAACTQKLFFVSPRVHWKNAKTNSRRIAYRYGSGKLWGNYDGIPGTPIMHWKDIIHDLELFHYIWVRPGKYWDFRKIQVQRGDSHDKGVELAKSIIEKYGKNIEGINKELKDILGGRFFASTLKKEDHPKHFHKHPAMVEYF